MNIPNGLFKNVHMLHVYRQYYQRLEANCEVKFKDVRKRLSA